MPTFLVRIIETRDLVGIFSADSVEQLILTVDECTEPDSCEYARLSVAGGIMWASPAIPIPIEFPDDSDFTEPDPMPWSEATLTERWWNYLHGYEKCRWKPFFPDSPSASALPKRNGPGQVVPFKKR
eukprot:gene11591-15483_t